MLLRFPQRLARSISFTSHDYGSFPYLFGNTTLLPSAQKFKAAPMNLREIISCRYKSLLGMIQEGELVGMGTLLEKRLHIKLCNDYFRLRTDGFKTVVRSKESPISVAIDGIHFICGGHIDREREIAEGLELVHEGDCLLYKNPELTYGKLILKLNARISTECRLDVLDPFGDSLIVPQQGKITEVHSLWLESEVETALLPNSAAEMQERVAKRRASWMKKVEDFTIVDLDNALQGNPHKDSVKI